MKSCNLRDFLSVYSFGIGTWQAGKSHWVGVDDQLIEDDDEGEDLSTLFPIKKPPKKITDWVFAPNKEGKVVPIK